VGQAVFTKRDIVVPSDWNKLVVVSHDYHIDRVSKIFDFVYGPGFDIVYESVRGNDIPKEVIEYQKISLDSFLRNFEGLAVGDDDAILIRMYDKHPLYNGSLRRGSERMLI
jgi:hypothetical protein